jgi:exosortase A
MIARSRIAMAGPWGGLWRAAPALLAGIVVLLLVFHAEGAAALTVWAESTAYSHCYFVLPIALYILWDRRDSLRGAQARPLPWLALAMVPLGLAWLLAERMGFMEGRQLVAMTMLELLFLTVLGWRTWWLMSAALLYLYFLVPFGAFLTVPLQHFTSDFIRLGLNLLGIPNYIDEFLIEIPEGRFFVAEACAGLRFLIAAVAFGVLYSVLIYRSPWRRLGFMLASIAIPIIANGFRALGIVVLGHILGNAQAAAADHIIYGWLFFSVVILLLILAGMPFREDTPAARSTDTPAPEALASPAPTRPIYLVAAIACVIAVLAPAVAVALDQRAGTITAAAMPHFVALPPCAPNPKLTPAAAGLAPGRGEVASYSCGAMTLKVTMLAFPPRSTMGPIRTADRQLGLAGEEVEGGRLQVPGGVPPVWRLRTDQNRLRASASMIWLDGEPARGGIAARLRQVRDSLFGTDVAPVLLVLEADLPHDRAAGFTRDPARRLLQQFLAAQYDLSAQIRQFATKSAGGR